MSCSVEGCAKASEKRGWCGMHYRRWRIHGSTDTVLPRGRFGKEPLNDRLARWSKPSPSGCLEWLGFRDAKGYGRITVDGEARKAHRVAWEVANGRAVPPGMHICHSCDNPPCINPAHLSPGYPAENVADMDAKGRRAALRGSSSPKAKLTWDAVRQIRSSNNPGRELAALYGVSESLISQVRHNQIWKETA